MGSEGDPRVTAAKELLRSRLEEVFAKTSAECYHRFAQEGGMPPPWVPPAYLTSEGRAMLGEQIKQWREESRECIREGFKSLVALMPQQSPPADAAKDLIWGVIDQVFRWMKDRNTSTRFREWLLEAGFSPPFEIDGLLDGLNGNWRQTSIPDQLNCDFRTQFERRLNQLENEAFLNAPAAQSTNIAPAAATYDPDAPKLYIDDPDLGSKDAERREIARAMLVGHVKKELNYFRTTLEDTSSREELKELALQYPHHIIFMRRGDKLLLCGKCYPLLEGKAYASLAYEIAAAKVGHVGASVMKKAWDKHPECHDLRASKTK